MRVKMEKKEEYMEDECSPLMNNYNYTSPRGSSSLSLLDFLRSSCCGSTTLLIISLVGTFVIGVCLGRFYDAMEKVPF